MPIPIPNNQPGAPWTLLNWSSGAHLVFSTPQQSGDSWKSLYKPYISLYSGCLWVIIPKNPYISPYKPYTMGTRTLGVHPSLSLWNNGHDSPRQFRRRPRHAKSYSRPMLCLRPDKTPGVSMKVISWRLNKLDVIPWYRDTSEYLSHRGYYRTGN